MAAVLAPVPAGIELVSVSRRFGALLALDALSASLSPGVITGLVGPDGAGKTTLLRLMAGLIHPTGGRLSVLGLDPIAEGDALRSQLGYMPQRFGLYEDLTVLENLELYAALRAMPRAARAERFARLLEFTALAPFTARPAGKLSGGMKQKLGLACVLLGDPRVLLLDEPSVGVDPVSRRELWHIVTTLAGEGITVVWSTSYLDEAERCPEIVLLNAGRIVHAGTPASLTRELAGRVVQLEDPEQGRRALLRRALAAPEVLDGVIQGRRLRLVLRGRSPPADAALSLSPRAEWREAAPRLEDAFIARLGGGPGGESALARRMPAVALAAGERAQVIRAEGLTRRFGDFVAVSDVSFTVPQGEIFGLLGPNGAGKSTTFKMLCGLLAPSAGRASVLGLDLRSQASAARQRLGYMAQKFSLYGNLSVAQNLRFFAGIYGLSGARARDKITVMVDTFTLAPYLDAPPDELPLGFRQRLALACAVMHDPAVLFLDEPTSGVDPVTRREFWAHINGLVEHGVTVLVTTHFMDEAEYCDRIGLVYQGGLIATGPPDELKAHAATPALPDPSMEETFIALISGHDAGAPA
jgi:ABC-2 type transport system ATP-binding protein